MISVVVGDLNLSLPITFKWHSGPAPKLMDRVELNLNAAYNWNHGCGVKGRTQHSDGYHAKTLMQILPFSDDISSTNL